MKAIHYARRHRGSLRVTVACGRWRRDVASSETLVAVTCSRCIRAARRPTGGEKP